LTKPSAAALTLNAAALIVDLLKSFGFGLLKFR
jgi:hypothetical protein